MGSLFPYVGPGASLFGLIRSLGVLLAILYVVAPQYVAGLNPDLVYWLSWSAMFLILFPLLRHMFVIVWSASGIFMWLLVVGVLFYSVTNPGGNRGTSTLRWPASMPNMFNLISYNGVAASQSRNVAPPSAFQYDRDGNQLRYVNFDDEPKVPIRRNVAPRVSSGSSSYLPSWLFANQGNHNESPVAAPWSSRFLNWGGSHTSSDEIGYDYEVLVRKYNPPRNSGPLSWQVARPDDNMYFGKSHANGIGESEEDGIGARVLGAGQDMADVVEKLARQTLGK